MENHYWYSY